MTHYHVDSDFDSLPYGFANDNRSPISKFLQGWQELWAAVLEEAFYAPDLARYMHSRDFERVCELANVKPDVMKMAAGKVVTGELQLPARSGRNKHAGAK